MKGFIKTYSLPLVIAVCCLYTSSAFAQFRVIGYLRMGPNLVNDVKTVNLDQVTCLNLAFINPQPDGIFKTCPGLDTVIALAHQHKVKVMLACGGGSRHVWLDTLLNERNRARVINNFIDFVLAYHFDGVDVDIENDDINRNYEPFVLVLSSRLHQYGKVISAALSYSTRNLIPEKALAAYDFVNLMAYDKKAPWRPNDPGQHSPYAMAADQINYWTKERGLAKGKVNIGVPFYGYGFGPAGVSSMSFAQIVKAYPGSQTKDEVSMADGGTMYYNGFETIRAKTKLALMETGGIMIWQLLSDASNSNSLLNQIDIEVKHYTPVK